MASSVMSVTGVGELSLLLLIAFSVGPVLSAITWAVGTLRGDFVPQKSYANLGFVLVQATPAFIAPEQALGGGGIDGRADIYAIGRAAYWLPTGQ